MNKKIVLALLGISIICCAEIRAQGSFQKSRKTFVHARFNGKSHMYKKACRKLSRQQKGKEKASVTPALRRSAGRRKAEQP
jgi:hypothetical protein